MIDTALERSAQQVRDAAWLAPSLLVATGSLLAVTILISRLASDAGAPMLWFLCAVMGLAGAVLAAVVLATGAVGGEPRTVALYSLGAGAFQALPTAMAYLAVGAVGAGYLSVVFAFPLLLTYVLALALGMDRFSPLRATGVTVALAGGLLIARGKFAGAPDGGDAALWIAVASSIPFVIAAGNLYRTRFWPDGAPSMMLAACMLLVASACVAPVAAVTEGAAALPRLWDEGALLVLTLGNAAAFALQFVAYMRLQATAGPVYLSQIGSVAALVGAPAAVLLLGETLPEGFALAATLVVAGAVAFQLGTWRRAA